MKTSEVLKKARSIITPPGSWLRGTIKSRRSDGGVSCCALGALALALGHISEDSIYDASEVYRKLNDNPATTFLVTASGRTTDLGDSACTTVYKYNDAGARTHAQVLEWFDKAIALAVAEEGIQVVGVTEDGTVDFGEFNELSTALKEKVSSPVVAEIESEVESPVAVKTVDTSVDTEVEEEESTNSVPVLTK